MGKRKNRICLLILSLLLLLVMPIGVSAAVKKDMNPAMRRSKKGYTVIAYNKTDGYINVYKSKSFKKGSYGRLENGAAVVVKMSDVRKLTKNRKKKSLTWIPVYMNNMRDTKGKLKVGYVYAGSVNFAYLKMSQLSQNPVVNKAIKYGYSKLGTQYVLGGLSMDYGIDCATFVKSIYEYAGIRMPYPHTDYLQLTGPNVGLDRKKWKAGDLLFYLENDTEGPIGHVAVYLGKQMMINSSGHYGTSYPNGGVCIKRVDYGARKPVLCIRINWL